MGDEYDYPMVSTFLALPFLGIGMRTDLFQSCGHCWVFQICWHNEFKTLMASSFRDVNSSAGISSHPLALLTAVLLKSHLTLHSRMSGSGWLTNHTIAVIQFIKIFSLCSSSMYYFHLLLSFSATTRYLPFLSVVMLIFEQNAPLMFPIFLKRSLVFPLLLFTSIVKHCSLQKAFLSLLAILWNSATNWMQCSFSPLLFISLRSSVFFSFLR